MSVGSEREDSGALVIPGVTLGERMGEGSLAEVFRATQHTLSRAVAVKVLRSSIASSSQLGKRFEREGKILSKLAHQNVPHIYDAGESQGRPFVVLELIEGSSLRALLDEKIVLSVETAVGIAHELALALAHVHAHTLVHRDVKPSNVLLSRTGDVKLTDFGLARELDEPSDGLGVVGTPAYMSPEQVLGDRVDFRSDLFSLGTVLYELLTGRRPFEEETARTVMQKIRLDRYTAPSALRKGVGASLERIVARCLEKHPQHRYPSADELAQDLGDWLASRKAQPTRVSVLELLAKARHLSAAELRSALATTTRAASVRRPWPPLPWLWAAQIALCAVLVGVVGSAELTRERGGDGGRAATGPRAPGTADVGRLRVVARPWATVSIDGVTVDTTPTVEAYRLLPGLHYVRFSHPTLGLADRVVRIERGATVWLEVDLGGAP